MTRRAVRVSLLLVLVAALCGAGILIAREERASAGARAAATNVDVIAWRVVHDVSEARAGLQAYATPGQDEALWRKKVGAALGSASAGLDDLRNRANDAGALNDLDAAATALEALGVVDARASRLVGFDSRAQAASLVFSDGLEAATTVLRRVESARQAERQAIDRSLLARRRTQAAAAAGAGLVALVVALLLAPRASATAAPAAEHSTVPARSIVPAVQAEGGEAPTATPQHVPEAAAPPLPAPIVPAHDGRTALELQAAADLCSDFARLLDSQELPPLLERAAGLLDASGLIVWVADARRQRLRPLLAHGYPAQALARLPAIPREADNATAAAYRGGHVEVVRAEGTSPGAIVVPILTGDGCVGVMAAELRHGRETSAAAPALARIVAAQLAALVSITPAQQAEPPAEQPAATSN